MRKHGAEITNRNLCTKDSHFIDRREEPVELVGAEVTSEFPPLLGAATTFLSLESPRSNFGGAVGLDLPSVGVEKSAPAQ